MKILAIGSHPDDIEFGCGGTLAKLSQQQKDNRINLLIMTYGDKGGKTEIRRQEQNNSAKILRAKVFWGGFKDTEIPTTRQTIMVIENIIKKTTPDIIFVHHPDDTHQDHRATAYSTTSATRYIKNVLFYEVPTTVNFNPANVFVDITSSLDKKLQLLKAHKSQVYATRISNLSILEAAQSTAIFRGYQNRTKYAEAFVPLRLTLFNLFK